MSKAKEKALTAKAILEADDLITETVDVPEWGGFVIVRTMMAGEKDRFQLGTMTQKHGEIQTDLKKMKYFRTRAVALSVVNEKGERLFTESQVEKLAKKSASAMDRVYEVAARLNGLGEGVTEELEKNLDPGPGEDSTSD